MPEAMAAATTAKRVGPKFLRNSVVKLEGLSVDDPATGWRTTCRERIDSLTEEFKLGNFGLTVACGVSILEKESADGKKLIDDGVSTVMALLACQAFFADKPGAEVPDNLADIFRLGLPVKVIQYDDDDDREARECWNVARHDEESFSIRWSSVNQKVQSALTHYRRHGDWTATRQAMLEFYGKGKEPAIGRWIRAAKGLDKATMEVLAAHPKVRGSYIWDNSFLVLSTTRSRDKLSAEFASDALNLLAEYESELTAASFVNKVCKPLRVVEIWHHLMCKRYGSIASQSQALKRLMETLRSWCGLANVRRCMESGAVLQDTTAGIPECALLVQEFDKCKAGGLPPPTRLPTEADKKAEAEAARKEAEEKEALEREAKEEEQRAALEAEEAARAAEADLLLLTSPTNDEGRAGVIAASPMAQAEQHADQTIQRIRFDNTPDALMAGLRMIEKPGRFICLIEVPTTSLAGFGDLLHTATMAFKTINETLTREGTGPLTKWRTVVLVGGRFDLLAKAMEKFRAMAGWSAMVVQLQRRDRQSDRSRPSYAVVAAPAGELTRMEPTVLVVPPPKGAEVVKYSLNMRCTEAQCKWRPVGSRGDASKLAAEESSCEIAAEDKVDLMAEMMADIGEEAMADDTREDERDDEDVCEEKKRDAIVDLWPYSRTPPYYTEILTMLGAGVKANECIVLSTTAHPSHWLASEKMGLRTWVITRRWSEHAFMHGKALARNLLVEEALGRIDGASGVSRQASADLQTIAATIKAGDQVVEAYDILAGTEWNDGINRVVAPQVLVPGSQGLVRKEAEVHNLRVSAATDKGRALETTMHHKEGDVLCTASALFFDDKAMLKSLLAKNPRFNNRVARIAGVMRSGKEVEVWAVLVGIAQFAQHFSGYRPRHNVVLEFDPNMGFSNGALRLIVATRTGVGIRAGSPVLLNYGPGFDLSYVQEANDEAYIGTLDKLFKEQKSRLPEAAAENEKRKAEDEAAQRVAEEVEKAEAAEASRAAAEVERVKQEQQTEAEKLANLAAAKKKADEEERKRLIDDVTGGGDASDAKRVKTEQGQRLGVLDASKCEVWVIGGQLVLRNSSATNKKVASETILAAWSTNSALVTSGPTNGFEYKLTLKSDVLDKRTMKRMKLDKYIKDNERPTREIFGYEPFPSGAMPKVLVKKGNKVQTWEYTGDDKELVIAALDAARSSTLACPIWQVKHVVSKQRVEPCGVAVVLSKAQQVPGAGEVVL